ncbi:titin homolog isoform X3 [Synchiropus splendidus]|uniref:titin homolog isoform X3 n=1 Tax=Synchiropus splendidus TaxID=270530 RepID=UPI00237D38AA|nr:titin homolog isoform X3 [Synchiropus splendidus]
MDRYDNLDLELECEGGGVAQKAALFGGMFKRSSKSAEPSSQDSLSVSSEHSKSNDSLNDTKDTGGVFKGMFKKSAKSKEDSQQDSLSVSSELSKSSDSLSDNTKDKGGVFKGMFKKATKSGKEEDPSGSKENLSHNSHSAKVAEVKPTPTPKPRHARKHSLDFLELPKTDAQTSEGSKESGGGMFGMFKRSPKPHGARAESQEDLSAPGESTGSTDNLAVNQNTKESGGMFGGIFKKSPKPHGARTQSQEDLSAPEEQSGSQDNLSVHTKESGGMFGGMFKKPFARTKSTEDLLESGEQSRSNDSLSEGHGKEKGGLFSGVFKKPKLHGAKSQDDLSGDVELSASSDSLAEKPAKGGAATKKLKNPFSSQPKNKPEEREDSGENLSSGEKPKTKQNGFSAMMKNTFSSDKQDKTSDSDGEELSDNKENHGSHKQSKLSDAFTKLNPFRAAKDKQSESEDEEKTSGVKQEAEEKQNAKYVGKKSKTVNSNALQKERKDRSETPPLPHRPAGEQKRGGMTTWFGKRSDSEEHLDKDMASQPKRETPVVPARPTEEELSRLTKPRKDYQSQSDDETLKEDGDRTETKTTRKKHKHHNPFMSRVATKAQSDDEGLQEEDESVPKDEKKEDKDEKKEDKAKPKTEAKAKRPKRFNPFMPQVKAKVVQKNVQGGSGDNAAENEGNRTLFDQLEDFRLDGADPDQNEDDVNLMEWWNTVEPWEDVPHNEDMTEKEEAKAFAVTADKVQKGIRVFNKLFSERAESLWQHVIDLNGIADGLDKFNKKTKIAQITGGSTSAIGGVATIAGLALAPVTMGTSLIVTAVGLGVATAGGLTSAGAGISNQVNNSMDRKKVEKIVEDYQEKMVDLNKCLKFIKQGIENLRRFDLIRMKNDAYNRDFPVLNSNFYEDGAMAGKAILINANEIMRVVQIANVAGSTAARAVQIASMATGVLTGLFVGMDIYFVAKDSKELKKGAKSEFAAKIRDVAQQLHDGLVELNAIREELQATSTPEEDTKDEKKEVKKFEYDDSSEDEIDRIKKAIKNDIENREYV